eukprot:TRINITY_DN9638_c0_g1_i9.p1 TRINITY_DN9638_c0_g1~~TRINITY_DN9638_c0_g1_i9.p1  ORF type:complete len:104 (+),score=5.66 TRINITY_DN9638_c0_g1_i9:183-494(+)
MPCQDLNMTYQKHEEKTLTSQLAIEHFQTFLTKVGIQSTYFLYCSSFERKSTTIDLVATFGKTSLLAIIWRISKAFCISLISQKPRRIAWNVKVSDQQPCSSI